MGPSSSRRHMDQPAERRYRAAPASFPRSSCHRRIACRNRRLAANSTRECLGSRPAIRLHDSLGPETAVPVSSAAATDVDPTWTPWLDFFPTGTPPHPEYPSGHSTVSGAAAAILTGIFGDDTAFTVPSDVRPGTRSFPSFSAAPEEINNARVFGGI